jgi:hypothetical protein
MTFVGIRYRITSVIRIRVVIGMGIGGRRIRVAGTRGIIPVRGPAGSPAGALVAAGRIIRREVMAIRVRIGITRRGVV